MGPSPRLLKRAERIDRRVEAYKPSPPGGSSLVMPDPRPLMRGRAERLRRDAAACPRPLHFLAQLDLRRATDAVAHLGLPDRGALWFFIDADHYVPTDPSGCRAVFYDADPGTCTPRAAPRGLRRFRHTPVRLVSGVHVPSDLTQQGGRREFDLRAALHPHPALRALGEAAAVPDWNRPRALKASRYGDAPVRETDWARIEKESRTWKCLLTLSSDATANGPAWTWGDVGNLDFWLPDSAWRERAFD